MTNVNKNMNKTFQSLIFFPFIIIRIRVLFKHPAPSEMKHILNKLTPQTKEKKKTVEYTSLEVCCKQNFLFKYYTPLRKHTHTLLTIWAVLTLSIILNKKF